MGVLNNLTGADISSGSGGGTWFQPGRYIVDLTEVSLKLGGFKGDSFIIKGEVAGSKPNHPEAPDVGETAVYVIKLGGNDAMKADLGTGNLMQFMTAALGVGLDHYTDAQWTQVITDTSDHNQFAGKRIALECYMNAKGTYTNHQWSQPTEAKLAVCGLDASEGVESPAPAAAPATPAPEPMRGKTADGQDIISHNNGTSWSFA